MKADLHIHTNYSDGVFSPEKVIDAAISVGLEVIALTDHDNILSYNVAQNHLKKLKEEGEKTIEVLSGVEINTMCEDYEIHILGYFMDTENAEFKNLIKVQQQARVKQTKEIVRLLNKEGINVKYDDITSQVAEGGSIGRPHIAKAITNAGGTSSIMEAYAKYINDNSPVYIRRKTVTPHEAVEIIYDAGGIPVIAHPHDLDVAEPLIKELMQYGLRGIEAYHRKHSPAIVEYFSSMAEELGLIVTGGSDFHAPNMMNGQIILGKNFVPDWIYDKLIKEKRCLDLA